ncbi:hypothetical protein H2O64_17390 [Kordia sp. YSTF-M3]|uniref:Uncharacterized protein n=1 Tax=Kordia aestuariivivens TaxID=2759037 RepID=A0ABR7QD03_9FLAO|nr:hypothetical protein [Kordia aestuariivivens]MBC8756452.1 hypothetical protein [Kordia aestuariivivens]
MNIIPLAIMIRRQLNGSHKAVLYVIVLILVSSCSVVDVNRNYNYFNGNEFYNDSLKISARFFGDINYLFPSKSEYKKIMSTNDLNISYKDLVVAGKAYSSPKYDLLFFYKIDKTLQSSTESTTVDLVVNDTIENFVVYRKTEKTKAIYVYLKAIGTHKSNRSMLQDGKSIVNSVRFDNSLKDELTYMKVFNTYKQEDNILFVESKFENAPIEKKNNNEWTKFQLLTTILSKDPTYKNYNDLVAKFELKREKYLKKHIDSILKNNRNVTFEDSFLAKIKQISSKTQVLMLNEMHWHPKHRIAALKMLATLKENGFKYLAVEAIDKEKNSFFQNSSFPLKSSGYYTREPYFGLFIREALKLGFTIVGYDDFSTENREQTQAINIKSILDTDPNAKIVVYSGIDHILEKDATNKRMAEYFMELTNINPVTIDQVEIPYTSSNTLTLLESAALKNVPKINTNVDYFLLNNLKPALESIYEKEQLKTINFTNELLNNHENEQLLFSFYFANEYSKYKSNSIAILNKISAIDKKGINFSLPVGAYQLVVKDIHNNLIISELITVD